MTFPLAGGSTWDLAKPQVEEWQGVYRGVDVLEECSKARAWLLANPTRLKTARGMPRFLTHWLARAHQRLQETRRDGAYVEAPGGRKPRSEADRRYEDEYKRLRAVGVSIEEARRLAKLAAGIT